LQKDLKNVFVLIYQFLFGRECEITSTYKIFEAAHIDPDVGATPQYVRSIVYSSPQHIHDYYEFFFITSGSCIHKVNNREQQLTEGTLVFIRPEDSHSYKLIDNKDCEFINIAYANRVVEEAFNYLGRVQCADKLIDPFMPVITVLSSLEKENLMDRYYTITAALSVNKVYAGLQLKGMLVEVLSRVFSGEWESGDSSTPIWFSSLIKQMQKKENFRYGLHKAYELSGRSKGHLNRAFRQYLNMTPTDYINKIRLNYAKNLLLTTDLSVIDISMEAGFQNLSHFNHLFKEQFNTAPLKMRYHKG
jgi:Transcriptional regulator containing an amidase domain and an AraC-type DNA-binding HTH domain